MARLSFALQGEYYGNSSVPLYQETDRNVRIMFPSAHTASVAPNCKRRVDIYSLPVVPGGTEAKILDNALVDYAPGQLLTHSKVLRVRWQDKVRSCAYVCITSANLSPTAWNTNWECGVLITGIHATQLDIQLAGSRYEVQDKWM
jgi:phosphatidylserine/phosphatidylglycerophosphate/cardiolipin synthase-like enzyme